jgi:hypothetical protein
MKKLAILAVTVALSQAIPAFAGPEEKAPVVPPPPPPPESFFRPNEFDIGAFATFAQGVGSNGPHLHGWGGGMDFTYWFPWKYAGVRFQGSGASVSGGGGPRSRTLTFPDGETATVSGGGGSVAAGVIHSDFTLRLPLDDYWPNVHLAPYFFVGFGGIFVGSPSTNFTATSRTVFVSGTEGAPATRPVTFTERGISKLKAAYGNSRVLGEVGGGLEYRFTPHIGLFGEAAYVFPDGAENNFVQFNWGLRYAF